MKAIKNIVSDFKANTTYAKANEPLKFIADYINVIIVENEQGKRFAALKTEVTEYENNAILTQHKQQPVQDTTAIINRVSVSKKAKPLNEIPTLF